MDKNRQNVLQQFDFEQYNQLFEEYDRTLNLNNFIRRYLPVEIKIYIITDDDIERRAVFPS